MSSRAYAAPQRFECRPSRFLLIAAGGVHVLALLVLPTLPLAWWIQLPVVMAVMAQGLVIWRRYGMPTAPQAIKRLVWIDANRWELLGGDGMRHEAALQPGAYIHPWLVILRFSLGEGDKRSCTAVLPRDSLDPDSHRRLRVRLRLQSGEKPLEA